MITKTVSIIAFLIVILSSCGGSSKSAADSEEKNDRLHDYEECINYKDIHRLNGRWILEKISGSPVEVPETRDDPFMEINLIENTISGYGGCNRFHGSIFAENGKVKTGSIASTRMYCLDTQEIENMFLGALREKSFHFSFDDSALILSDDKMLLTFRRAE